MTGKSRESDRKFCDEPTVSGVGETEVKPLGENSDRRPSRLQRWHTLLPSPHRRSMDKPSSSAVTPPDATERIWRCLLRVQTGSRGMRETETCRYRFCCASASALRLRTAKAIRCLHGFRIDVAPLPSPQPSSPPNTGTPNKRRGASSLRTLICRRLIPSALPLTSSACVSRNR